MAREEFTAGVAEREVQNGQRDGASRLATTRGETRRTTETKSALKTTELIAFVVAVVAVLVATSMVDQADAGGLGAGQGWTLVTVLTVGYMVSRGLAKSGSRERYTEQGDAR